MTRTMKIVTINIPDQYLDAVEILVGAGFYPSRSEAIRQALKSFIQSNAELDSNLQEFDRLKNEQIEKMTQYADYHG